MELFKPESLIPPHKITKPEQVAELAISMDKNGWLGDPLIGYYYGSKVQLLSGTHRRAAAELTGISVPVFVRSYKDVARSWGNLQEWKELMTRYE